MFTCHGTRQGLSSPHQHDNVLHAKICYGILAPAPVAPVMPTVPVFGHRSNPSGPLSQPQFKFICDLGGDAKLARGMTYTEASNYIDQLKGASVSRPSNPANTPVRDKRFDMVDMLVPMVPDGYYAVGNDPERIESLTFIRVSKPEKGRWAGTWKFQQVIGNAVGYRLADYAFRSSSARWSFAGGMYKLDEVLTTVMQICADHQTAAILYARHIGRCARCNAVLTDERSRWYGIGPECEKHWPHHMEQIEATKGVFR